MADRTRRELLEDLRDRLISGAANAVGNELPALSRELRLVLAELDSLPSGKANTPTDEIAKRREERRRKAAGE